MQYTYNALSDSLQLNEVEIYNNFTSFPSQGNSQFFYFDKSTAKLYCWSNGYKEVNTSVATGFTTGVSVGGIKSNTQISGSSVDKIIQRMLVPGSITLNSVSTDRLNSQNGYTVNLEVGDSIYGTSKVTATYSKNSVPTNLKFNQYYSGSQGNPLTSSWDVSNSNEYTNGIYAFSTIPGYTEFYFTGVDDFNQSIESSRFRINWVHRSFAVATTSATLLDSLTDFSAISNFIITESSVLSKLSSLSKSSTLSSQFIYIFLPTSHGNYSTITSSGFVVPYTSSQKTLTKTVDNKSTTVVYNVYKTNNSFKGALTLNMS
jgi:hypothetical protein